MNLRFHLGMACAFSTTVVASILGCRLTQIAVPHLAAHFLVVGTILILSSIVAIYWHERNRPNLRDAALLVPWAAAVVVMIPFPLLIVARFNLPLEDALFAHADAALGVYVPGIVVWAKQHWIGGLITRSYALLSLALGSAILLPVLTGKVRTVQRFIVANLIAFAIALVLFALLPAVGPWYSYRTPPTPMQASMQAELLQLRVPGPLAIEHDRTAIITFPSFHTIWAILAAGALWSFPRLRIPAASLASSIVVSTLTTGWHYLADVLSGALVAGIAMYAAQRLTR